MSSQWLPEVSADHDVECQSERADSPMLRACFAGGGWKLCEHIA
jgi:hypothetical protein